MMKRYLLYVTACALMLAGCVKEPKTVHVSSVSLDKTEMSMQEGESATLTATVLPADAADKSVKWTSSDQKVATVSTDGKVTAVAPGETTVTVTSTDGGKTAACVVTVNSGMAPFVPEVEGVQLWENGPFWATCNVGADSPEEFGLYFSWGNVIGYAPDDFTFSYSDVFSYSFDEDNYLKTPGSGLDGNIPANSVYDAACANMGTKWRIPTAEEFDMLVKDSDSGKTTIKWEILNGVKGMRVSGKGDFSDNSIFLPTAAFAYNTDLRRILPEEGNYWTSTGVNGHAYYMFFSYEDSAHVFITYCMLGLPIRPVMMESDCPDPE